MIVKYNTVTGDILSYAILGLNVPDEIPDGIGYMEWFGIEPDPLYKFKVENGVIISKSTEVLISIADDALSAALRTQRNTLLAESDYVILPDAPYSEETKTAYRTYRQALRDLPSQAGFPNNVTWPAKPT